MISKRIKVRKDGKSSALDALKYGAGLKMDRASGEYLDKSHRTRFGGFGLIENGVYLYQDIRTMASIIESAGIEMQANCDMNSRVDITNKMAHFIFSFDQKKPTEAVLLDVEDSTLSSLNLNQNHFATFLHNDNGHWHLHIFSSRIEQKKPHRGNSLWQDKVIRDRICREVEIRHGLKRDNGLHEINPAGIIVEIPRAERQAKREIEKKSAHLSDIARSYEKHTGERSFQSWCNDIRIGDRLKHSKSWMEIHSAAAAYNCVIKPKGAGYIICPIGENGGIQLSKIGLKNLSAQFGRFTPVCEKQSKHSCMPVNKYKPEAAIGDGALFKEWREEKLNHQAIKNQAFAALREAVLKDRSELSNEYKNELTKIRSASIGEARTTAISLVKMNHAARLTDFIQTTSRKRSELSNQLAACAPGITYKDYLSKRAIIGDDAAHSLLRVYSAKNSTQISCRSEIIRLKISATFSGANNNDVQHLCIKHQVQRNGTVVYDLGQGRSIIDSAIIKQIQLNSQAANDLEAIEISLRFAVSKFGRDLTLTGSKEFQVAVVQTAVRKGLVVKFNDPALEKYRGELTLAKINLYSTKGNKHVERIKKIEAHREISSDREDRL
jgi:hypothetical protein